MLYDSGIIIHLPFSKNVEELCNRLNMSLEYVADLPLEEKENDEVNSKYIDIYYGHDVTFISTMELDFLQAQYSCNTEAIAFSFSYPSVVMHYCDGELVKQIISDDGTNILEFGSGAETDINNYFEIIRNILGDIEKKQQKAIRYRLADDCAAPDLPEVNAENHEDVFPEFVTLLRQHNYSKASDLLSEISPDPLSMLYTRYKDLFLVHQDRTISAYVRCATFVQQIINSDEKWDLSKKGLSELPCSLFDFEFITDLNISGNHISTIPSDIKRLRKLKRLMAWDNDIMTLPGEIALLKELEYIKFSNNPICSLPEELSYMTQLKSIDISFVDEVDIPPVLARMNWLTDLKMDRGKQAVFFDLRPQYSHLKNLVIRNCRLTAIPEVIFEYKTLNHLTISGTDISVISSGIAKLKSLTWLYMNNNKIKRLPKEIGNLSRLVFLFLYDNELSGLPAEIGRLKSLGILSLSNNKITSLPREIGQLKLKELALENNLLETLPAEMADLNMDGIDLSKNRIDLQNLPPDFWNTSIYSFSINANGIKIIPPAIDGFKSGYLNFDDNELEVMPVEMFTGERLIGISVKGNQIKEVPKEIAVAKKIRELNISGNQISSLPEELFLLPELQELDISNNPIKLIPAKIAALPKLSKLIIDKAIDEKLNAEVKQQLMEKGVKTDICE